MRFGLNVNQDSGTYSLTRADDFRAPDHPILAGVNQFDGEGVSPGVIVANVPGVTPQVLVNAKGTTRNNDNATKGSDRPVTENDGALVVAEAGLGRVAISFDRNTFFNANGAGTDLHHLDNETYARNLFEWLAGRSPPRPQVQAESFQIDEDGSQKWRIAFNRYVGRSLSLDDVKLINRKTGEKIAAAAVSFDASSNTASFTFVRLAFTRKLSSDAVRQGGDGFERASDGGGRAVQFPCFAVSAISSVNRKIQNGGGCQVIHRLIHRLSQVVARICAVGG